MPTVPHLGSTSLLLLVLAATASAPARGQDAAGGGSRELAQRGVVAPRDRAVVGGIHFGGLQGLARPGIGPQPAVLSRVRTAVSDHQGSIPGSASTRAPSNAYQDFPAAGTFGRDLFLSNYVDLDAGNGIRDFACRDFTYEGHDAHDAVLRTFESMDIGVPVYAALGGVVVSTHDGEPDRNTTAGSQLANYVVIDHGNGRSGYYWHLKNGSVAVQPGQSIAEGQQIGLVGSSGSSNYPHLHFATYDGGTVVEPMVGPCHPGPGGFVDQPPVLTGFRVLDRAVTWERPDVHGGPPHAMPRGGHVGLADPLVYLWITAANLPANSTWRLRFLRPDGTIAFTSQPTAFGNGSDYRWSWWWWGYDVPEMHTLVGAWRIELWVNGHLVERLNADVLPQRTAAFNRPPAVPRVVLRGLAGVSRPARCEVVTNFGQEDPDYDVLTYRYEWLVNGRVVRDVDSAATSDLLAEGRFAIGDTVQCTVTVSDGRAETPPISVSGRVGTTAQLDFPDPGIAGTVNTFAFRYFTPNDFVAFYWSPQPGAKLLGFGPCTARVDLGFVGVADFVPTDLAGQARWDAFVPPSAAGMRVWMQAVDFGRCEPSNLIGFTLR